MSDKPNKLRWMFLIGQFIYNDCQNDLLLWAIHKKWTAKHPNSLPFFSHHASRLRLTKTNKARNTMMIIRATKMPQNQPDLASTISPGSESEIHTNHQKFIHMFRTLCPSNNSMIFEVVILVASLIHYLITSMRISGERGCWKFPNSFDLIPLGHEIKARNHTHWEIAQFQTWQLMGPQEQLGPVMSSWFWTLTVVQRWNMDKSVTYGHLLW